MSLGIKISRTLLKPSHQIRPVLSASLKQLVATGKTQFEGHELLAGNSHQISHANARLRKALFKKQITAGIFETPATNKLDYVAGDIAILDNISDRDAVEIVIRAETSIADLPTTTRYLGLSEDGRERLTFISLYFEAVADAIEKIFSPIRQKAPQLFYYTASHDALVSEVVKMRLAERMVDGDIDRELIAFIPVLFSQQPRLAFFIALGKLDEHTRERIKEEVGIASAYEILFDIGFLERIKEISLTRVNETLRKISSASVDSLVTPEERQNIRRLIYGDVFDE